MTRRSRLLLSAGAIGAYALVMFSAAGFFYSNYREVIRACSRFSYADCSANEAVIVSTISLKIGAVAFFLMGICAWMFASYLAAKVARLTRPIHLP